MSDEFHVRVNDYKFACFIEDILKRAGFESTGGGIDLDSGWRDLWYERVEFPESADFIPVPIEVNLPDDPDIEWGESMSEIL